MKKLVLLLFVLCFNSSVFAMFSKKMSNIFMNAIDSDRLQLSKDQKASLKKTLKQNKDYQKIEKLSPVEFAGQETFFEDLVNNIFKVDSNQSIEFQIKALNIKKDFLTILEDEFLKTKVLKPKVYIIQESIKKNNELLLSAQSQKKEQDQKLRQEESFRQLSISNLPKRMPSSESFNFTEQPVPSSLSGQPTALGTTLEVVTVPDLELPERSRERTVSVLESGVKL